MKEKTAGRSAGRIETMPDARKPFWTSARKTGAALLMVFGYSGLGAVAGTTLVKDTLSTLTPRPIDRRSRVIEGDLGKAGLPVPEVVDGQEVLKPGMADVINKATVLIWLCANRPGHQLDYALSASSSPLEGIKVILDANEKDATGRITKQSSYELKLNTAAETATFVEYSETACKSPAPTIS